MGTPNPARRLAMDAAQIAAVERLAAEVGATAYPVFEPDGRICELAIWAEGEWLGSVLPARAWSSIGDRWFKTTNPEQAVRRALHGKENSGLRGRKLALGGFSAAAARRVAPHTRKPPMVNVQRQNPRTGPAGRARAAKSAYLICKTDAMRCT